MIEVELLRKIISYNPESGVITWTNYNQMNANKGKEAGSRLSNKYIRVFISGKNYQAHRLAWAMYYGEHPESEIDHIDGDRCNNSIANLRCVTSGDNSRNSPMRSSNKSGFNGVTWCKTRKKWRARLMFNRKDIHLGSFETKEEAISARKSGNLKYGFHENHGRVVGVV